MASTISLIASVYAPDSRESIVDVMHTALVQSELLEIPIVLYVLVFLKNFSSDTAVRYTYRFFFTNQKKHAVSTISRHLEKKLENVIQ